MCSLLTVPVFARLSHRHKLAQRKATPRRAVCSAGSPLPTRLLLSESAGSHTSAPARPLKRSLAEFRFGKGLDLTLLSFLSLGFPSLLLLLEPLKGPTLHFPHPRSNSPNSLQPAFHPPRWNCPSKVPHPHWVLLTSLFSPEQPLGPQPHTAGLTYPCASTGLTTDEQLGREGRRPVHQALWTKTDVAPTSPSKRHSPTAGPKEDALSLSRNSLAHGSCAVHGSSLVDRDSAVGSCKQLGWGPPQKENQPWLAFFFLPQHVGS